MERESQQRKGFTIIEVALVLAVSGLILVGLISGVSGSVARQRYNDSVQSVAEEFRVIYSQVNNPQGTSDNSGRSLDQAIYGKIALIGTNSTGDSMQIDTYTIVGNPDPKFSGASSATKNILTSTGINATFLADSHETFVAPWEATAEQAEVSTPHPFTGALLIVHSPNSGSIHTYFTPDFNTIGSFNNIIDNASTSEINLCLTSPDVNSAGGRRRNIRITEDARNSTAVQLIDVDGGDSKC